MPLLSRPDGDRVRDESVLRRFIPFVMPGRNESCVFFEQQLDVGATLAHLSQRNARETGGRKWSFFHVVLAALGRTLEERPKLNRFVVGRRLYQRRAIELSFAVKKRFEDDAPLTTVKTSLGKGATLDDVAERIDRAVGAGRGEARTTSEGEMGLLIRLPRFLVRLAMALQRAADYFGLLPAAMIRTDPLYASAFVANLGSVGIDAAYHHLYEYGTVPLFVAIGRIRKGLVVSESGETQVRDVVTLRFSFDERVADGFYCARSLELFQRLVENPQLLESPRAGAASVLLAGRG
jgi:hypothetical protein